MRFTEVCIVGGGPAGLLAALKLRLAGFRTLVLGFDPKQSRHIDDRAETVAPFVMKLLAEVGLEQEFASLALRRVTGFQSTWGSERKQWRDALLSGGEHWFLDRPRFESMLGTAARQAGAELIADKALNVRRVNGRWNIPVASGEHETVLCDLLVVAAGRSPVKEFKIRPIAIDRLVACIVWLAPNEHNDQTVRIDTVPEGWLYLAQGSHDTRTLIFFTDGDFLRGSNQSDRLIRVANIVYSAPCIRAVVSPQALRLARGGHVLPAMTRISMLTSGENWVACGDAAQSFDPLSSHGIAWALQDGADAAKAIAEFAGGRKDALSERELSRKAHFADYLRTRYYYYRSEPRWFDEPFWKRRSCSELEKALRVLRSVGNGDRSPAGFASRATRREHEN